MNYTWELVSFKKTDTQNVNNAIIQTFWKKIGTDENGNTGSFDGATPFNLSTIDPNNFIEYQDLTEEIILNWIKSVVVDQYEEHVNEKIQEKLQEKLQPIIDVNRNEFPWKVGISST